MLHCNFRLMQLKLSKKLNHWSRSKLILAAIHFLLSSITSLLVWLLIIPASAFIFFNLYFTRTYRERVELLKKKKMELMAARASERSKGSEVASKESSHEDSSSDDDSDVNFAVDWRAQHLWNDVETRQNFLLEGTATCSSLYGHCMDISIAYLVFPDKGSKFNNTNREQNFPYLLYCKSGF